MTKQTQTTDSDRDKKPKPQAEPIGPQATSEVLPPGLLPFDPQAAAGDGSIEGQAALLSSRPWQGAQRQALVAHMGRVQGNRHVQRMMAQMEQELPSVDVGVDADPTGEGASKAAAPKPVFDHSGDQTVTIDADTASDFVQKITNTIGNPHTAATFEPDIKYANKTNPAGEEVPGSRKITSIGLKVVTAITIVRFGKGRTNAQHKKAIDDMVKLIKAHEEKHRDIIEKEATLALAAMQKFVGSGQTKQAEKALTTALECTINKKHEALDAQEGQLTAVEQPDGSVKVTPSSSGAKYPCP